MRQELLRVGTIASTHGIRGEVKVFPTTDDTNRFKTLKHCILDTGREKLPLEVEGVKFFKQFAILKFKGYDNINDIEMLREAGYSYAVSNSRPEVQAAAQNTCPPYWENGVLQILKSFL